MNPMKAIWLRIRRRAFDLPRNDSGLAAIEFAMIFPLMGMMLLGTYEFSAGVAIDRKVTIMARTLSDLTSQNTSVTDAQFTNFFNAGKAIMTPYDSTPLNATVSELYIDPATLTAKVKWSKGSSPRATDSTVSIPSALKVGGTYLIYSEVSYNYVPAVGYVMAKSGITLSDFTFTRPRQSLCVLYSQTVCPT